MDGMQLIISGSASLAIISLFLLKTGNPDYFE
jgi:hypothetical protein